MNDLSAITSQFAAQRAARVSVVLPLHNAGRSISERIAELAVDAELGHVNLVEIIAVDDGSSDFTWGLLEAEARYEPRLRPIRLRRRFGEEAAREVGLFAATGDIVITLEPDAPAADLGQMVSLLEAGDDVIIGWRGDARTKPSAMLRMLTGLQLRSPFSATAAYRREVLLSMTEAALPMFSLPLAAHRMGYRVGEMQVSAPRRRSAAKWLADIGILFSSVTMMQGNERWLGLAMLAGAGLAAAAGILLAAALLTAMSLGAGLASGALAVAGLALLFCGLQLGGMAIVCCLGLARQRRRSRVSGWIAETLLQPTASE